MVLQMKVYINYIKMTAETNYQERETLFDSRVSYNNRFNSFVQLGSHMPLVILSFSRYKRLQLT